MGSGASIPADVHVVVVGAGYGGVELATKLLDKKANFTLIEQKDNFHHNVASVRAAVISGFAQKTLIPLAETFGTHFKQGRVTAVDARNKKVQLASGEHITYNVLVLATGSRGTFPSKIGSETREEAIELYEKYAERVRAAQRVVCVGGGAVGVEVAAEVATEFPDKDVTVVHAGRTLVFPSPTDKFHNRLLQLLGELGVRVILDEKVANLEALENGGPGTVQTVRGTSIDADLVVCTIGISVNSDAYRDSIGSCVEPNGSLRVNEFLQVEGEEDIFAVGDCCQSGDAWMAHKASDHANHVFDNLVRKASGQPLKPYKPSDKSAGGLIVLSLGRHNGIGQTAGNTMIPEFLVRVLKCRDLFVQKYWKTMKQNVPK